MFRIISRTVQVNRNGNKLRKCYRIAFVQQTKSFSNQPVEPEKSKDSEKSKDDNRLGGFAKAFNEFNEIVNAPKQPDIVASVPFKKLLRNSKFFDLGDPLNKIVSGKIVNVVQDDLYIDFGWKFNCVCLRPSNNGHLYVRGATVSLKIKELELSSRFLGEDKDLTILEADCELLGLVSSPKLISKSMIN